MGRHAARPSLPPPAPSSATLPATSATVLVVSAAATAAAAVAAAAAAAAASLSRLFLGRSPRHQCHHHRRHCRRRRRSRRHYRHYLKYLRHFLFAPRRRRLFAGVVPHPTSRWSLTGSARTPPPRQLNGMRTRGRPACCNSPRGSVASLPSRAGRLASLRAIGTHAPLP